MSWYADGARKLAVSYCNLEFQAGSNDTFIDSYIWDIGKYRKRNFLFFLNSMYRKSIKT
jgi:hypothetical protein